MIPKEEKEGLWHYPAVKKLSTLLRGITAFFHSFTAENKLKSHEKVCRNTEFSEIVMPSEKDNILEFNQYMKSDIMPYIFFFYNNIIHKNVK